MSHNSRFWDALAPFHAEVEDSNFDLASVRGLLDQIQAPVLVVGAGQGLIVGELRQRGYRCDGVDLSVEMVRHAALRRGIEITHADARAMPFASGTFETIIYATGVIDFTADEPAIRAMLSEGRRVLKESGKIFVAFYRMSAAQEKFLMKVGLLTESQLAFRRSLELYLLNPTQMVSWVAKAMGVGYFHAAIRMISLSARCTAKERRMTLRMQRIFRKLKNPESLIGAAPETQPYRNEREIKNLFSRLDIPIKQFRTFNSCCVVMI